MSCVRAQENKNGEPPSSPFFFFPLAQGQFLSKRQMSVVLSEYRRAVPCRRAAPWASRRTKTSDVCCFAPLIGFCRVHVHARPRSSDTHAHVCRAKHKQTALDCLSTAATRSTRAHAHHTRTRAHITRADSARYARARAKTPFLTPKANQNQSGKIL